MKKDGSGSEVGVKGYPHIILPLYEANADHTRLPWGEVQEFLTFWGCFPCPVSSTVATHQGLSEFHVPSEAEQHITRCRLSLSAPLTDVDQVDFETYLSQSGMLTMSLVKLNGMTA